MIKYLYAVSNHLILKGTFPLTTLSKHSQKSVTISRFEVFLINRLSWSCFSCNICRRADTSFFFFCDQIGSALDKVKIKTVGPGRVIFEQKLKQNDVRGVQVD